MKDILSIPAMATLDSGNTAWMLVATILVLLMTIPGLALFYGGLVRRKNILSIIMQCFILTGVITLLWFTFGYSFVFGTAFMESGNPIGFFIGVFKHALHFFVYCFGQKYAEINASKLEKQGGVGIELCSYRIQNRAHVFAHVCPIRTAAVQPYFVFMRK